MSFKTGTTTKKATTTFLKFLPLAKLVYIHPRILLPYQGIGSDKTISLMVRSFSDEMNARLALKGKFSDVFSKSNVSSIVFSLIYLYLIEASIFKCFFNCNFFLKKKNEAVSHALLVYLGPLSTEVKWLITVSKTTNKLLKFTS